jgi:CBS domain-containing protein
MHREGERKAHIMSKHPLHKKVGDLMSTEVVSMRETDLVSSAAREMTVSEIRHMPVVDGKGRLVGLVSASDLVAALGRQDDDPALSSVMIREVFTVKRDTPAERAVALMIDRKFNSVPVIGPDRELLGILTATDFLVVAYQALTGAAIERLPGEI